MSLTDAQARAMVAAVKNLHFEYLPVWVEWETKALEGQ